MPGPNSPESGETWLLHTNPRNAQRVVVATSSLVTLADTMGRYQTTPRRSFAQLWRYAAPAVSHGMCHHCGTRGQFPIGDRAYCRQHLPDLPPSARVQAAPPWLVPGARLVAHAASLPSLIVLTYHEATRVLAVRVLEDGEPGARFPWGSSTPGPRGTLMITNATYSGIPLDWITEHYLAQDRVAHMSQAASDGCPFCRSSNCRFVLTRGFTLACCDLECERTYGRQGTLHLDPTADAESASLLLDEALAYAQTQGLGPDNMRLHPDTLGVLLGAGVAPDTEVRNVDGVVTETRTVAGVPFVTDNTLDLGHVRLFFWRVGRASGFTPRRASTRIGGVDFDQVTRRDQMGVRSIAAAVDDDIRAAFASIGAASVVSSSPPEAANAPEDTPELLSLWARRIPDGDDDRGVTFTAIEEVNGEPLYSFTDSAHPGRIFQMLERDFRAVFQFSAAAPPEVTGSRIPCPFCDGSATSGGAGPGLSAAWGTTIWAGQGCGHLWVDVPAEGGPLDILEALGASAAALREEEAVEAVVEVRVEASLDVARTLLDSVRGPGNYVFHLGEQLRPLRVLAAPGILRVVLASGADHGYPLPAGGVLDGDGHGRHRLDPRDASRRRGRHLRPRDLRGRHATEHPGLQARQGHLREEAHLACGLHPSAAPDQARPVDPARRAAQRRLTTRGSPSLRYVGPGT